jgi:hypothetical protein
MQEDFLQYLWKYGLFPSDQLRTQNGEKVEVLSTGQINSDSGPDFLYARIRIDSTVWVGHVEIHCKASDWYRHRHHEDPAYDTVILHVAYEPDCEVKRSSGEVIPAVRMPVRQSYLDNYHKILSTLSPIPCERTWQQLPSLEVENWLINMGIERMETKAGEICRRLAGNRGGWDETLLQIIVRSFGFGINQEIFDRLGSSFTLAALRFAGSHLFRLEALLFGQSALIPRERGDVYVKALAVEYGFLKKKLNLIPLENPGWKFLRMRPANFPTVRIAQLASFLAVNEPKTSVFIETRGLLAEENFDVPVSTYWKTHYDFGRERIGEPPGFGQESINLFRINVGLPYVACHESRHGRVDAHVSWMERLESLPSENNRITRLWSGYGYQVPNAFYSQAFLHLYNTYCRPRRCLNCRIGQALIRNPSN